MNQLELVYFDFRGRGEPIRLLLAELGLDYKDTSFSFDQWPNVKPSTPFGQVPYLIETKNDGTKLFIPQSIAVLRHLSRIGDRYGHSEEERTRCDYLADEISDWRTKQMALGNAIYGLKDDVLIDKFEKETLPLFLNIFEKELQGSKNGYLVGDDLTYPDIMLFDVASYSQLVFPECLKSYPLISKLIELVRSRPRLSSYITTKQRPVDPHLIEYRKRRNLE